MSSQTNFLTALKELWNNKTSKGIISIYHCCFKWQICKQWQHRTLRCSDPWLRSKVWAVDKPSCLHTWITFSLAQDCTSIRSIHSLMIEYHESSHIGSNMTDSSAIVPTHYLASYLPTHYLTFTSAKYYFSPCLIRVSPKSTP